jgi:predicted dehydrogenase
MKKHNVAIIGCGLIGEKRAKNLDTNSTLKWAIDASIDKAEVVADDFGSHASNSYVDAINDTEVDIVIVATPHNMLSEIALAAINANKHVLVEKPGCSHITELCRMQLALENSKSVVQVGFNHRYHLLIKKAKDLLDANVVGELMMIRGEYGHGGRIGYEKEWRMNPAVSGGGELIDKGSHLIDLANWFIGSPTYVEYADLQKLFWNAPPEDNAVLYLRSNKIKALLHASSTQWRNKFAFELWCTKGKLVVEGLGGSYGTEKLTMYKMDSVKMGIPEITTWEHAGADLSWRFEWQDFISNIEANRVPMNSLYSANDVWNVIQECYDCNP